MQPLPASVILSNAEVQKKRLVVLTTEWLPWLQDTKVMRSLFWYWRLNNHYVVKQPVCFAVYIPATLQERMLHPPQFSLEITSIIQ